MAPPALECVPNVSEGRRPRVVARLADAAGRTPGVQLLDVSSDPDHNRSVLTLAGDAAALIAGMVELYAAALAEIDLRRHQGVHPRAGAVDVAPFVPLGETPMAAALGAALGLAAAVAGRFDLPVYLYEEAARIPQRRSLPAIRRGGFEGFAAKLADPQWAPDLGPNRLHPTAGVTVIGARPALIAFNALLDTADVEVARAVARAVRESGGGLPAVRALGVYLPSRGRAQVSMNLLDFRRTSMAQALARVSHQAAALGSGVVETEVVGLLPRQAALDAARVSPELAARVAHQILEDRLR
ncbi:MAG TPA: glutamate formimidoyltransferase [Thermoanaerobaculia bacterium]|nr:glutamate formimidoyltransferase [Thermoanaerobaculia bacterium]